MFITHRPTLTLQLHNFDLFSSFCTVTWQLAKLQLTQRIARSLGDSGASCFCIVSFCRPTGLPSTSALWTRRIGNGLLYIMGRCHCHSRSLASVKSRLVLPFWYWPTRVVSEKVPLNGCVCVCVCVCRKLQRLTGLAHRHLLRLHRN